MDRMLTLELVRVTERAAIAAAAVRGRGDEQRAHQAAVDAMWARAEQARRARPHRRRRGRARRCAEALCRRGSRDGEGPEVDIACDPLDGRTLCAKNLPNSLAAIAITRRGGLLNAPDVYMEKIAIGPGYPADLVDLQMPPAEAIKRLAEAKGVKPGDISACILDRPRHAR